MWCVRVCISLSVCLYVSVSPCIPHAGSRRDTGQVENVVFPCLFVAFLLVIVVNEMGLAMSFAVQSFLLRLLIAAICMT